MQVPPQNSFSKLRQSIVGNPLKVGSNSRFDGIKKRIVISKMSSISSMYSKIGDEFDHNEDKVIEDIHGLSKGGTPKQDINFDKHADQKYKCKCNICEEESHKKKEKPDDGAEAVFFMDFNFEANQTNTAIEKDFVFILKRLIPPKNMAIGLRIHIPDTACFIQGECKFIAYTGKDKTLKFIKQKDKLILHELRKYFEERRRKRDDGSQNYEGEGETLASPYILESRDTMKFEAAGEIKNPKKISSTKMMGDYFTAKEVGLVKYRDDSTTMLTEPEFNNTILRRKIDPIWKQIQYLQSCTKTKKVMNSAIRVYFVYEKEKETSLYKRALNEIKFLNGEILRVSEDFIPPHEELKFEEELKANNEKEYFLYILMKVHHFLDVIYGVKVFKMGGDFIIDEMGTTWLINISRVQYTQTEIASKDDAPLRQVDGLLAYEPKDTYAQEVEGFYKDVEKKETVRLLNNIIKQHYENIKRIVGLEIPEAYYDEKITDEMFAKLHPTAPFKLSEILRSSLTYDEIRTFIVNNARRLLYPHSNASQGMSPDLLAKYSYSGTLPKAVPGVIIKKSNVNEKKKLPIVSDSLQLTSSRFESSRRVFSTNQSIQKGHKGVKSVFSGCFTNTWWNLKPEIRDLHLHYKNSSNISNVSNTSVLKIPMRTSSNGAIPLLNFNGHVIEDYPSPSRILFSSRECSNFDPDEASPGRNKDLRTEKVMDLDSKPTLRARHIGKTRSVSHMRDIRAF